MMKNDDLADLDAYDQGRVDTNERFIEILKRGIRETKTKEELVNFIVREIDISKPGRERQCDCD